MEKTKLVREARNEMECGLEKEKLPKTKFEQIDLDKETELVYSFMNDKSGRWSIPFDKKFPELRVIQKESRDKEECLSRYRKFLESVHLRDKEQMISAQRQIQETWKNIGSAFLEALSQHFRTDWPDDKPELKGFISALPAYPRFLDDYSFCLGYKDIPDMIEVSAHKILHFLWFKKWKEVFPETERREYESPNLCWRLSEIMDPIILQCNPKLKKLVEPKRWGYSSFKNIKIGNAGMTEYFKDIYLKSIASADSFEITLKKLWEEAQKHEGEINKF
jgi:hypothetical protein